MESRNNQRRKSRGFEGDKGREERSWWLVCERRVLKDNGVRARPASEMDVTWVHFVGSKPRVFGRSILACCPDDQPQPECSTSGYPALQGCSPLRPLPI